MTLIGHATCLIETGAGNLLTDPVFFDPFEEGTVVSCQRRFEKSEKIVRNR